LDKLYSLKPANSSSAYRTVPVQATDCFVPVDAPLFSFQNT